MVNRIDENLSMVFGDHKHNVARFYARSPDGDYTIEFTINESGEAYWNLASYPPSGPPSSFEVVDADKHTFWLVRSEASDLEAARDELSELLSSTGRGKARIRSTKTFYSPEIKSLRSWAVEFIDAVRGVVR